MGIFDGLVRKRLLWVISGILPLALFAVWMFLLFTEQQEEAISQLMNEAAGNAAHVLERTLGEQIGILDGLATARSLDTGDFELFRISAERLEVRHPEWRTVILTDVRDQLFNLRVPPGKPLDPPRDPKSLERVWRTKEAFIGDFSFGYVAIRVPVIRDHRVLYTLVAPVDPQFFLAVLQGAREENSWQYIISGSDDIVIAASPETGMVSGMPLSQHFIEHKEEQVHQVEGMLHAQPVKVPASGWRLFLLIPGDVVKAPYIRTRQIVFAGGLIASLLTVVLILAISAAWVARHETERLRQQVDERTRVQETLEKSEMALKEAQSLAEVGSWSWDLRTGSHWWSEETYRIYGRDPGLPAVGYPEVQHYFTVESWSHLSAEVEKALAGGGGYICDAEVVRDDGEHRWITVRGVAERDRDGNILQIKGTIQDITGRRKAEQERQKLQEQLLQAQKMESVGRLAGGVAHDFNNILSVIIGHTELAMEEVDPASRLHADLQAIYDAAQRSTGIIRQLLTFSRKQIVSPVILDLNDIVEGMLKMLRRLIGEDIELTWHPAQQRLLIRIDPSQVDQVLANLCVNARDAIADTGRISIETDRVRLDGSYCDGVSDFQPGEFAVLSVSDSGSGMGKDVVDKIFEPFFTTKGERGTGLGLATVYGIARQNNGNIHVYSEPGKGTTFKIYLPLVEDVVRSETGKGLDIARGGSGEVILMVEDDPGILGMGSTMLERMGYVVLAAATPEQGIAMVRDRAGAIDILLTDVIMPQMNGKQLAEKILALHPGVKVVYMSGYTANVIAHHGVLDEGIHFLQKPFTKKDLAAAIREVLG